MTAVFPFDMHVLVRQIEESDRELDAAPCCPSAVSVPHHQLHFLSLSLITLPLSLTVMLPFEVYERMELNLKFLIHPTAYLATTFLSKIILG